MSTPKRTLGELKTQLCRFCPSATIKMLVSIYTPGSNQTTHWAIRISTHPKDTHTNSQGEKIPPLFVLPFLPETTLTPLNASLPGLGLLTPRNSRNLPNGVTSDATKWLQIRTRGRLWWKCKKRLFTKHLRSQGISSGAGTYYQTR